MEGECAICAETIDGVHRLQAVGTCNHLGVCSLCYLRLRSLIQSFSCPICKTELENVVCSPNPSLNYQDFTIWGENAGSGMRFDHKSRMFFPSEYYSTQVAPLWSCKCNICDAWKRDIKTLSRHVTTDHENKFQMCGLCIENKKVFPSEQRIYTKAEYDIHLKSGGEGGFEGHPKCEFCKKRYYDKDALFVHLQKDHFTCHLCDKMGIRYRYYNDYNSLETHFRKEHILCEEPECLAKKFVVFADPIDHAAHMINIHPNIQMNRAIPVHFRSRRDEKVSSEEFESGGGFGRQHRGPFHASLEGGMGGRNVGGEWQVELPDAARDPREVIREQRRQNGAEVDEESFGKTSGLEYRPEDYPALISESESSKPLWVGRNTGQKSRNEDFPSLSSGTRGAVTTGWGSTVKVNNKLTVVKPRGLPQPAPRPAAGGIKGASVIGLHPPPPPKSVPVPQQQKEKKPSGISLHPTPRTVPHDPPKLQAAVEELTLAEKIRGMSLKGTAPVPSAPSQIRVPSPATHDYTMTASSPSPNTMASDSPDDYPALPTKKEKKTAKLSSNSSSGASWNATLSSYGFEGGPKPGKTGSGIYLAKPKSATAAAPIAPTPLVSEPPPGFVLLDNEPPPGFFSPAKPKSSSSSSVGSKPTMDSSRIDFPGNWAPIGGSRGVQSSNDTQPSGVVVSDSDYPTLPGKSNGQGGGGAGQKKNKSIGKKQKNELQSLAFKVNR